MRRFWSPINDFFRTEALGGVLVLAMLAVALFWANGPFGSTYEEFWHNELTIDLAGRTLTLDFRHVVNDLLMALFFFVVGLEVKREVTTGELRKPAQAALPIIAAIGGMALPALIFIAFNAGGPGANGWAIPMATDIAIALAVLSLIARNVSKGLKSFLLTLAIVDDIGAIVVIAIFFADDVRSSWLVMSALLLSLMVMAWRIGLRWLPGFVFAGFLVWLAFYESGVHPTIAGALIGMLVPVKPSTAPEDVDTDALQDVSTPKAAVETADIARKSVSLIEWLEHKLHPYSSYLVLPLFALANGGIQLTASELTDALTSPVTLGIVSGLVLGKLIGISGVAWVAHRLGLGILPEGVTMRQLVGVGAVAGIGFTVALFVAELSLPGGAANAQAKVGIVLGSLLAALLATLLLRSSPAPAVTEADKPKVG